MNESKKGTIKGRKKEASGDLGDPGSRKIIQIAEDLNRNNKYFLQTSISTTIQCPKKVIKG